MKMTKKTFLIKTKLEIINTVLAASMKSEAINTNSSTDYFKLGSLQSLY